MSLKFKIWNSIPETLREGYKNARQWQIEKSTAATIHPTARIGHNVIIRGDTEVGRLTNINEDCRLISVKIGKFCAFAPGVMVTGGNHSTYKAGLQGRFYERFLELEMGPRENPDKPKKIGNDVWLGSRCIILPGVEIGDGAIIGAGAVVTKDVEPYEVVAGNPAKHIRYRFPEHIREQLLEIEWWKWSDEKIKRNKKFFDTNFRELDEDKDLKDFIDH